MLVAFRMLGRNCTFDDGAEATFIGTTALRTFFISFVDFYANKIAPNVIEVPKSAAAIAECVSGYEAAGFPGFLGSVRYYTLIIITKKNMMTLFFWGVLYSQYRGALHKHHSTHNTFGFHYCNNKYYNRWIAHMCSGTTAHLVGRTGIAEKKYVYLFTSLRCSFFFLRIYITFIIRNIPHVLLK